MSNSMLNRSNIFFNLLEILFFNDFMFLAYFTPSYYIIFNIMYNKFVLHITHVTQRVDRYT